MAEDMMIEITGSATKAVSALDKAISKLSELQNTFDKLAPSLTKFTEKLSSIASSSKAISALKGMTDATSKQGLSAANAESKQAMYQARLDRSTVSMDRSAVSSSRLAEAQKKLRESSAFDTSNQKFLDNYKYNPTPNTASDVNKYSEPISTDVFPPTPPRGSSALATDMESNKPKSTAFTIDTAQATSAVDKMRTYIDSVAPSITRMSETAQQEFGSLSSELIRISSQIDNQRALYSQLAQAATNAASANGEGSAKYLQLEKRMLSADGAMDKLIAKQEKLKSSMSGISDISGKAGSGMTSFGEKSEKSASKATSGFQKTLNMMEKMFIRIIAFRLFSMVSQGITTGLSNIAQVSQQANASLSAMSTSSLYLKNSIAAALMPTIEALTPLITGIIDHIADLFNMIGMLTARIFNHATTVTIAKKSQVDYAASIAKTGAAADAAKKSLMGFDEINILSQNKSSSSSGTAGMPPTSSMFETVPVPGWVNDIGNITDPFTHMISEWWGSLTTPEKWGVGLGATAGVIIGGIIGNLICPGIGGILGGALGGVIGGVIGKWWADLTLKQKWNAGIGAGVGATIGGIIGGIIGGSIGVAIGATLGGVVGAVIGKWWGDLTTPEKWSVGIGAGAGAAIGGIIGGILTGGNPIGVAVGIALGGTIGSIIGKWWGDLTSQQKWSFGGRAAGSIIGGIIGTLICPGIGTVLGVLLGGAAGSAIGTWWSTLTTKQKWNVGIGVGAGAIIGGILGTLICPGIGTVLGAALGGSLGAVAGSAIEKLTAPFKNIKWPKITTPHLTWGSGGWEATGWIKNTLSALHIPTTMPKLSVDWYAKGGLFDSPQVIGVGEGASSEAVIPLNNSVFSSIGKGIAENSSGGSGLNTDRIVNSITELKTAIRNMSIALYADDRKIAESSNRGNQRITRSTSPTA